MCERPDQSADPIVASLLTSRRATVLVRDICTEADTVEERCGFLIALDLRLLLDRIQQTLQQLLCATTIRAIED